MGCRRPFCASILTLIVAELMFQIVMHEVFSGVCLLPQPAPDQHFDIVFFGEQNAPGLSWRDTPISVVAECEEDRLNPQPACGRRYVFGFDELVVVEHRCVELDPACAAVRLWFRLVHVSGHGRYVLRGVRAVSSGRCRPTGSRPYRSTPADQALSSESSGKSHLR